MAKLSKEEFIKKYNDMFESEDFAFDKDSLSISLMEDITDSIDSTEGEELKRLQDEIKVKDDEIAELKRKYKERFLNAVTDDDPLKIDELKEEEVIDIKEI